MVHFLALYSSAEYSCYVLYYRSGAPCSLTPEPLLLIYHIYAQALLWYLRE